MTHGAVSIAGTDVAVNAETPAAGGVLPLAVATQPLVPPSGVIQPLPPLTGFSFLGVSITYPISEIITTLGYICVGRDGNMWSPSAGAENKGVMRITLLGDATLIPFAASTPYGICSGADGNIYVTDTDTSSPAVWQITPDEVVTEFAIPDAVGLFGICSGPDENLWVCDRNGGVLWQVTTDGTATSFPLDEGARPQSICAGPDGNLWLTALNGAIYRVTTSGEYTKFAVGGGSLTLVDICAGPDGNVWFTYLDVGDVVRITPDGTMTRFHLEDGAEPYGICAGAGGDLWVTNDIGVNLWKVTPEGGVTSFTLPNNSYWLCVGPDGAFWIVSLAGIVVAPFVVQTGGLSIMDGLLFANNLPTEDPGVVGMAWNNSSILSVSAG